MTHPAIDQQTMKRLAFIRLLFARGVDDSKLPEPLAFTAVLPLHDAVELFLILAGEHLGASLDDRIQFMKYWTELHPNKLQNGVDLSGKVAMDRLNRLRNGFKHAGTMPGIAAIEQARADVANFFEDNTPRVFGISFAGIDMADLVPQPDVRAKIRRARRIFTDGDVLYAAGLMSATFQLLTSNQTFVFGHTIGREAALESHVKDAFRSRAETGNRSRGDIGKIAKSIGSTHEAVRQLQDAAKVMSLGIDFRLYRRFKALTPFSFLAEQKVPISRPPWVMT
ncbi:hypothetical protein [Dactylosporangium sp. NPDC049140]|uniref:hypothetical protein n=1 Tax=Dactylosporangium sp. NPDC049140 TaxID=3155647 RepID=UPI0033D0A9CF